MAAASDYLEATVLDMFFVNATTYLALFPADTGENDAPADEIPVPRQLATWTRNGNRVTLNTNASWSNMPGVTVGALAVMTSLTGGHVLAHENLTEPADPANPNGPRVPAPKAVNAGDTFTLPAGVVSVTVD